MGDVVISKSFREKLANNLNNFRSAWLQALQTFSDRQAQFTNSMQSALDQVEYFRQGDFVSLYQRVKTESMAQFLENTQLDGGLKYIIHQKLDQSIDEKIRIFEEKNNAKHTNFVVSIESKTLFDRIKTLFHSYRFKCV